MDSIATLIVLALAFLLGVPVLLIVTFLRTSALRDRLERLEREVAALRTGAPALPDLAPVAPPSPIAVASVVPGDPAAPSPAAPDSVMPDAAMPDSAMPPPSFADRLEALATGRGLAWAGAAVLALGVAFLVKVSIDEGLLGPAARVALGGLFGIVLIVVAIWLARRQPAETLAPQALVGAGLLSCYLAVWAGFALYDLLLPPVAFAMLVIVSAAGFGLAWILGQPVAWLGLVGAFAVPAVVDTGSCAVLAAAGYLAAVLAAAEAVGIVRGWGRMIEAARGAAVAWAVLLAGASCPDGPIAGLLLAGAAGLLLGLSRLFGPPPATRVGGWLALVPPAAVADLVVITAISLVDDSRPVMAGAAILMTLAAGALWVGRVAAAAHWLPALPAAALALLLGFWPGETAWPLLAAAISLHALAGFFQAARDARPLLWAGYAVVPPLGFATAACLQAGRPVDGPWPMLFVGLAAASLGACTIVSRARVDARSDAVTAVFACGVSAGLGLAAAALFRDAFLTAALALQIPVLIWAWQRWRLAGLVPLAALLAALIALRTAAPVIGWFDGSLPPPSGRAVAAGWVLPAAVAVFALRGFAGAALPRWPARLFAAWGPAAVAVAAVAIAWAACDRFTAGGLSAAALVWVATDQRRLGPVDPETARPVGLGLAAAGAAVALAFPLLADNPALSTAPYPWIPVVSGLAGLGVAAAGLAVGKPWPRPFAMVPAVLSGLLLLAWSGLEVRAAFRGDALWLGGGIAGAELYTYSAVWMGMAIAVLALGLWRGQRALRLAGLALVGVVAAKVFLVDMSELTGVWRALSFIGLGLTLVGIGYAFRRALDRSTVN